MCESMMERMYRMRMYNQEHKHPQLRFRLNDLQLQVDDRRYPLVYAGGTFNKIVIWDPAYGKNIVPGVNGICCFVSVPDHLHYAFLDRMIGIKQLGEVLTMYRGHLLGNLDSIVVTEKYVPGLGCFDVCSEDEVDYCPAV